MNDIKKARIIKHLKLATKEMKKINAILESCFAKKAA